LASGFLNSGGRFGRQNFENAIRFSYTIVGGAGAVSGWRDGRVSDG